MDRSDLAASRFRLLLRQLAEEGESQRAIAKTLGLSQGSISFYVTGGREPGRSAISAAMDRLSIASEFFFDPALGEDPAYRDHLRRRERVEYDWQDTPAWLALVESGALEEYRRAGVPDERIEQARRTYFEDGRPIVDDYLDVLDAAKRSVRRHARIVDKPEAAEMEEARNRNLEEGVKRGGSRHMPAPGGEE